MRRAVLTFLLAGTGAASAGCAADLGTRQLVERTAAAHGLPPFLLTALVVHESGFCAQALSPAGAIGYGQLMPATARTLGVNPYVPQENLWGAAKYLRQQWTTFANWPLALAAYNAGPGAVRRFGRVPPYAETQAYVRKVLTTYAALVGQHRRLAAPVLATVRPVVSPAPVRPTPQATAPTSPLAASRTAPAPVALAARGPATVRTRPAPPEPQVRSDLLVFRAATVR
ncbi:transglycosylase SLT domain-containing protein [Deinococcus sp. HMF7604]|uniref:lytic transglycosylase domain-containing protein n=1 Tax=Deinococcus betulae TaxID=2873312 RepID=UPI001CCAAAE7|nr:lytic transglycosylase domain-containing protein [Deinococcus betulae]MBZ9751812.1 transglycosylase SLT domain-containing protein [Deinococcus betulae]